MAQFDENCPIMATNTPGSDGLAFQAPPGPPPRSHRSFSSSNRILPGADPKVDSDPGPNQVHSYHSNDPRTCLSFLHQLSEKSDCSNEERRCSAVEPFDLRSEKQGDREDCSVKLQQCPTIDCSSANIANAAAKIKGPPPPIPPRPSKFQAPINGGSVGAAPQKIKGPPPPPPKPTPLQFALKNGAAFADTSAFLEYVEDGLSKYCASQPLEMRHTSSSIITDSASSHLVQYQFTFRSINAAEKASRAMRSALPMVENGGIDVFVQRAMKTMKTEDKSASETNSRAKVPSVRHQKGLENASLTDRNGNSQNVRELLAPMSQANAVKKVTSNSSYLSFSGDGSSSATNQRAKVPSVRRENDRQNKSSDDHNGSFQKDTKVFAPMSQASAAKKATANESYHSFSAPSFNDKMPSGKNLLKQEHEKQKPIVNKTFLNSRHHQPAKAAANWNDSFQNQREASVLPEEKVQNKTKAACMKIVMAPGILVEKEQFLEFLRKGVLNSATSDQADQNYAKPFHFILRECEVNADVCSALFEFASRKEAKRALFLARRNDQVKEGMLILEIMDENPSRDQQRCHDDGPGSENQRTSSKEVTITDIAKHAVMNNDSSTANNLQDHNECDVTALPSPEPLKIPPQAVLKQPRGRKKVVVDLNIPSIIAKLRGDTDKLVADCHQKTADLDMQSIAALSSGNVESAKALHCKLLERIAQIEEFKLASGDILAKLQDLTIVGNENEACKQGGNISMKDRVQALRADFGLERVRLSAGLPIYAKRTEIVSAILSNKVSIVVADTGSGKSTQIPQYLYDALYRSRQTASDSSNKATKFDTEQLKGRIVCTQPRKVAAVSLAKRVAEEMSCVLGQQVGYKVGGGQGRFNRFRTKLLFATDTSLLNECLKDPLLSEYSVIIVDEAHERSLNTDILLGMLKRCLAKRPDDLRIVITSATINPALFVSYFGEAEVGQTPPIIEVEGRIFPVEVKYQIAAGTKDWKNNFLEAIVGQVQKILKAKRHQTQTGETGGGGDILAFVTTPIDTELATQRLRQALASPAANIDPESVIILPLHGRLQAADQQAVFDPTPRGKTKVVFATNSAETSVTIPGVSFVVDCGLVKERRFDPKRGTGSLVVGPISKSSANQRKGRAGRTGPGTCYRMYPEEAYEGMAEHFVPEIKRVNLGQAVLYLLTMDIENPLGFDFIEAPAFDALKGACVQLLQLKAIEINESLSKTKDGIKAQQDVQRDIFLQNSSFKLTETGKQMAQLTQLEPRLAKLVLGGVAAGVGRQACIIAACMTVGNLFYRNGSDDEKQKADMRKLQFCSEAGDPLTMLTVYEEWIGVPEQRKGRWCLEKSINGKCMKAARDLITEVHMTLRQNLNIAIVDRDHNPHPGRRPRNARAPPQAAANVRNDDPLAGPLDQQPDAPAVAEQRPAENLDAQTIQKRLLSLLAASFAENLAVYSGHSRTGYFVPRIEGFVQLHPSCAFDYCEVKPQWITFEFVLETSATFAHDVSLVSEDALGELVANEIVTQATLESARARIFQTEKIEGCGEMVKKCLLRNAKCLCQDANVLCGRHLQSALCVLDSRKNDPWFSLTLFANTDVLLAVAQSALNDLQLAEVNKLRRDFIELPIHESASLTRLCIGHGFQIQELLFGREDYRSVAVRQVPADKLSIEGVKSLIAEVEGGPELLEKIAKIYSFGDKAKPPNAGPVYAWGNIGFDDIASAKRAVELFPVNKQAPKEFCLEPLMPRAPNAANNLDLRLLEDFRVRIEWERRPCLGFGVVKVNEPEELSAVVSALSLSGIGLPAFSIPAITVRSSGPRVGFLPGAKRASKQPHQPNIVSRSKRNPQLEISVQFWPRLSPSPWILDDTDFRQAVEEQLRRCGVGATVQCYVVRKKADATPLETAERFAELRKGLEEHIRLAMPVRWTNRGFNVIAARERLPVPVEVEKPRHNGAVWHTAWAKFPDEQSMQHVIDSLHGMTLPGISNNGMILFTPCLNAEITIPRLIFAAVKGSLDEAQRVVQAKYPSVSFEIVDGSKQEQQQQQKGGRRQQNMGRTFVRLQSEVYRDLLQVKATLREILSGDVIDCPNDTVRQLLFHSPKAEKFFRVELEKPFSVHVAVDLIKSTIVMYGSVKHCTEAKIALNAFINRELDGLVTQVISTRPGHNPPGLLKAILAARNNSIEELTASLPGCLLLKIECAKHQLTYQGRQEGLTALERLMAERAAEIRALPSLIPAENGFVPPDCPVCLCATPADKLYCLEACGHFYCLDCVLNLIKSDIQNREFPIVCIADACATPLVIADFNKLEKAPQAGFNRTQLAAASLQSFLRKYNKVYGNCFTKDCHGVYRKSTEPKQVLCELCNARQCTACGEEFHADVSCAIYAQMKRDGNASVLNWAAQDPGKRKHCPKTGCDAWIEYFDGCKHMTCTNCNSHFCWVCLKIFPTGREVYQHLGEDDHCRNH